VPLGDPVLRHVVTFGRVLREAGLEVGPGRLSDAFRALDAISIERTNDVYWALRTTLVSRQEDVEAFDRAFRAWFLRSPVMPQRRMEPPELVKVVKVGAPGGQTGDDDVSSNGDQATGWSAEEILRTKDFGELDADEARMVRALIAQIATSRPRRRSRRLRPHVNGTELDLRRLVRASLATGGEPIERAFRRRAEVPRKLVLICDVSGSMEVYARALLLFFQAILRTGRGVEAFAFGTRLTRLTHELATRDPGVALEHASQRVADWSGGTRIGASLKAFNDEWGRRALTRGAVVVIASDGWERESATLVGREMARLARAAYAVVWVNPLKGSPDYQPLAGGMRAALPYVDRFVSGQNLLDLENLADLLAGIERRHAA
jgi:hypothetical protein